MLEAQAPQRGHVCVPIDSPSGASSGKPATTAILDVHHKRVPRRLRSPSPPHRAEPPCGAGQPPQITTDHLNGGYVEPLSFMVACDTAERPNTRLKLSRSLLAQLQPDVP